MISAIKWINYEHVNVRLVSLWLLLWASLFQYVSILHIYQNIQRLTLW